MCMPVHSLTPKGLVLTYCSTTQRMPVIFSMTWVQDGTSVCAVLQRCLQISPASFGTRPKYIRAWKPKIISLPKHQHKNKLYHPPSKFSFQDVSLVAPCSTHPVHRYGHKHFAVAWPSAAISEECDTRGLPRPERT